jgi:hypothetical protein
MYGAIAYLLLPAWWRFHYRHPALEGMPKTTLTANKIPGDPLNVALVGTRDEVVEGLIAAGWLPADQRTWRTSVRIAGAVLLRRSYPTAPVSDLFVLGKPQDLAFQQPVGRSPVQRHHVRFWESARLDEQGRPLWIGAATFDRSVGLAGYTGQVTHHIDADVDQERDKLLDDLENAEQLETRYRAPGVGPTKSGRNGGRDRYFTDGDIVVGVLIVRGEKPSSP